MTDSRITATATNIPEKLMREIKKVINYYNSISPEAQHIVFLEIDGIYYKGRVTLDDKGRVVGYSKMTVEKMRSILTRAAMWRTMAKISRYEQRWVVNYGGKCPRDVAIFAVYEMQPTDLPDLLIYRFKGSDRSEFIRD